MIDYRKPGEAGEDWILAGVDASGDLVPEPWDGPVTEVGGTWFQLNTLTSGKWHLDWKVGDPSPMFASIAATLGPPPLRVLVTASRVVMICPKPGRLATGLVGMIGSAVLGQALVAQIRYEWLRSVGWARGGKESLRLEVTEKTGVEKTTGLLDIGLAKGVAAEPVARQIARLAATYRLANTSDKTEAEVRALEAVKDAGPIPAHAKKSEFSSRGLGYEYYVGGGQAFRPPVPVP
jgi:hypothetical protein